MSGPVTTEDAAPSGDAAPGPGTHDHLPATVEVLEGREVTVGGVPVRRALPRRARRTIGAWCFADRMGPVPDDRPVEIGPHPHIGLHTVTWLFDGELLHRDSLGSEQVVRPGQLNLMTAGVGVAHSEESTGAATRGLGGVQLWVAQPERTRFGAPAFEHHPELPRVDVGAGTATVLVGAFAGVVSPASRDSEVVGVDLELRGPVTVELRPDHEHGLVVCAGGLSVGGVDVAVGSLVYLGAGRDECHLDARSGTRVLVLGGVPFDEELLMWWNFVARTREEIDEAFAAWRAGDDRFPTVATDLAAMGTEPPSWWS